MDHISTGTVSTNSLHPSSSSLANTITTTTSSSSASASSSVIVQQSSSIASHANSVQTSTNELDNLGASVLSSTGHLNHNNSATATTTGHGAQAAQELTPVQQQRIISTTQQHLTTPTGPGSAQSPVLSPPGKVYGRNYNGTSE